MLINDEVEQERHDRSHTDGRMANRVKADELPSSDSKDLVLTQTTEKERLEQLFANGASWRGALSIEAYIRRENHLIQQETTKNGGLTSWALVDELDTKIRRVLCGCETYKKAAVIAKSGVVCDSTVYGVGSVFCPGKYRGKGYAGRMMREVSEKLRKRAPLSVLFSDIGRTFYRSFGWEPFSSTHLSFPVHDQPTTFNCLKAKLLYDNDLAELCELDERNLRWSLAQASSACNSTHVALLPTVQTMRWHHAREEFIGLELHGRTPLVKGAIVGETPGSRTWCYWTRTWNNPNPKSSVDNSLFILRLVAEGQNIVDWENNNVEHSSADVQRTAVATLLQSAREEARHWGLEKVEVWNPNAVILEAARLVSSRSSFVTRETQSICSLRWNGDEGQEVIWLSNEKYGWC